MTKQEKIKEAYGNYSDISLGLYDENGWIKISEYYTYFPQDSQVSNCGWFERPKSLKGIENNNWWIKINSESDLPKEDDCIYWAMSDNGWIENTIYSGWSIGQKYKNKTCTHYKLIEKPILPIY